MNKQILTLLFLTALLSSCVEDPTILRKLSDEDATVIPYKTDDMIKFIDNENDTLTFKVVDDDICKQYEPHGNHSFYYAGEGCYTRVVTLYGEFNQAEMRLTAMPDKKLSISLKTSKLVKTELFDFDLESTQPGSVTINGIEYNCAYTNLQPDNITSLYSQEYGLLSFLTDSCQYQLLR